MSDMPINAQGKATHAVKPETNIIFFQLIFWGGVIISIVHGLAVGPMKVIVGGMAPAPVENMMDGALY